MHGSDLKSDRDAPASAIARLARSSYSSPKLLALGSFASVTRMMANGPYADGMLGLMNMQ